METPTLTPPVTPNTCPFLAAHPQIVRDQRDGVVVLQNGWGDSTTFIQFPAGEKDAAELAQTLNRLLLPVGLRAVYHRELRTLEFIYTYLDPQNEEDRDLMSRHFAFTYLGREYKCEFREPSTDLLTLARHVRPSPGGGSDLRNLRPFRDAQRLHEMPKDVQAWLSARKPCNFFVHGILESDLADIAPLCRHLNFVMLYHDRLSPRIDLDELDTSAPQPRLKRLRLRVSPFPSALIAPQIDPVLLNLLETARSSPTRLGYLFYYQVFEYAAFRFTDEEVRRELRRIVRNPSIIACSEETVAELHAVLAESHRSDDEKMKRMLEASCDPEALWGEIEAHKQAFAEPLRFDGGFELKPLIAATTDAASWQTLWSPKLFDSLTRLRNAIVHAREKRESRVVLPTNANDDRIETYLPLIRRAAEEVALRA